MKPIQKLDLNYSIDTYDVAKKQNEIIDRLNSLTGEEKKEPVEKNKFLYRLYRVPYFCKRVWGEDGDGDRYAGMAVNLEDETAKARLEGQIEGLRQSIQIASSGKIWSDVVYNEINILKQQLTNLK